MKTYWIEYEEDWRACPLTYWVHREADGKPWHEAEVFDPPAPKPVVNKGFWILNVEIDGYVFRFSSIAQMNHCIDILSRKLLPTTISLSRERGGTLGPEHHWLSRLPKNVKPWRYRSKAVKYLREVRAKFF